MTNENIQDQLMRDAQYRKSRSIAFFNSTNSAINLLAPIISSLNDFEIKDKIVEWRDWFLAEYDKDYKANVMTIGLPPQVMQGLDDAKKAYESK